MNGSSPAYAGFWIRFLASLIDGILWLAISMPILLWIYGKAYWDSGLKPMGTADVLLEYVIPSIAEILFWRFKQATPGNLVTRTRIVDAATGGALSTGQCLWRFFASVLAALPLFLGYLWIAWDPKKQGWHDKLAGTFVVHKEKTVVPAT